MIDAAAAKPATLLLVACALAFPAAPALAKGNAANGLKLARQWCSSCHLVEQGQAPASDKAPPFSEIAQRNDTKWIEAWLANPHPPMTGIQLSRPETDDIVAYVKSLAKP